jgi:hypothetical protein
MYEHRLFIIHRIELHSRKEGAENLVIGNTIAEYNCSRMPYSFFDLFADANEIDFPLFVNQGDACVETKEDCYGNICTMLKLADVIAYLENLTDSEEWGTYRRLAPLLGLLKGFDESQWEETGRIGNASLWVVHYGY